MQESKPVVVVVPTAWHSPQHYSLLFDLLQKAGYAVSAQPLPSVNPATPVNVHVATDAEFVRHQQLLPLLDQGKDVLLVMHGYGGCPGGMAATGLSKKQRSAEGVKGGVVGLVFVAGFLLLEGESVFSKLGGRFEPWHVVHEDTGVLTVSNATSVFYGDVPEPLASNSAANLLPHSKSALMTPCGVPAWTETPYKDCCAYIRCMDDAAVHVSDQDSMLQASGVSWNVHTLGCSHSPFLSCPADLVTCLTSLAVDLAREVLSQVWMHLPVEP